MVLGPGSLLTASKVGTQFGYDLLWVLAAATVLMIGTTVAAASVGVTLARTPGGEIAAGLGRPAAALVGLTLFLVVVSFQGSNNAAVLAAADAVLPESAALSASVLLLLNAAVAAVLWLGRDLYRPIERLMKALVGLMAAAFLLNLLAARPSIARTLGGLVPRLPDSTPLLPTVSDGTVVDPLGPVLALVATTFSIAGAFYQSYLVRERRAAGDAAAGDPVDAVFGIAALGGATAVVMLTAAAALHGRVAADSLTDLAAVSDQLSGTFGAASTVLFAAGILAGALSSFLVNALIGGTLMADGLGLASGLNDRPQKAFTTAALALGAAVALLTLSTGDKVSAIVLMQKLTLLGGPLLAAAILYLALRSRPRPPVWSIACTGVGAVVVFALAIRSAYKLML